MSTLLERPPVVTDIDGGSGSRLVTISLFNSPGRGANGSMKQGPVLDAMLDRVRALRSIITPPDAVIAPINLCDDDITPIRLHRVELGREICRAVGVNPNAYVSCVGDAMTLSVRESYEGEHGIRAVQTIARLVMLGQMFAEHAANERDPHAPIAIFAAPHSSLLQAMQRALGGDTFERENPSVEGAALVPGQFATFCCTVSDNGVMSVDHMTTVSPLGYEDTANPSISWIHPGTILNIATTLD